MASSVFVLPWPFSPARTLNGGCSAMACEARLRNARTSSVAIASTRPPRSDAHGHDDGEEALVAPRLDDDRIELAGDAESHLVLVERREHVEDVADVEADRHVGAGVVDRDLVEGIAAVGVLAGDPHDALRERQLYAA